MKRAGRLLLALCPLLLLAAGGRGVGIGPIANDSGPSIPWAFVDALMRMREALARHAPQPAPFPAPPGYLLPWPEGVPHTLTQGPFGSPTHGGTFAYDFDLSFEVVVAARGGRVIATRESDVYGGCIDELAATGNYVVIDHGDGTGALYLHLDYDGLLVQEGQIVRQGDAIAYSGDTGMTCADDSTPFAAPHLHFEVFRFGEDGGAAETLPVAFDDVAQTGGEVWEGQTVVSRNDRSPNHVFYVFMSWTYVPRAPGHRTVQWESALNSEVLPAEDVPAEPPPEPAAVEAPSPTPEPTSEPGVQEWRHREE